MLTIYNNSNNQIIHSCFKFIQGPLLLVTSCHLSAVHSQNKCTNVQIITSKRKCKSCFCLVHVRICWPHLDLFTTEASKYPWAGKISSARLITMPPLPLLPLPADSSWFYSFKAFSMLKQKHSSSPSFFPPPSPPCSSVSPASYSVIIILKMQSEAVHVWRCLTL